ncbi:ALA-interacting subunit 1-like isoform X2 [Asparagus officinalis]|uniref:ALA-interacting subunit 1-like isoform X2 n=1 Tax=Asparagus officinalis TaxID=4686 RepID=UPI00098E3106|nr:ALA-interacting subunit 1-like isoform X2 [Asparagus officinalis]
METINPTATTNPNSTSEEPKGSKRVTKPRYSRFMQQELPSWNPILTPRWVIFLFSIIAAAFIPIGIFSLQASHKVVEIVNQYEKACANQATDKVAYIQDSKISKKCTRILTVPRDMKSPIFVYYQLDNFYQNHRRYFSSRNNIQLKDPNKASTTKGCKNEAETKDKSPIVPCGLIAWSLFNDTFSFSRGNETLEVNKKEISWNTDRNERFGNDVYPKNFQSGSVIGGKSLDPNKPLSEQEDLMVWMRVAALPTFRKLYGKIEVDLKANDKITVSLENNYNTYSFGGTKKLVLSTATWIGESLRIQRICHGIGKLEGIIRWFFFFIISKCSILPFLC